MRRVALLLCVVASTAVASPRASNPAFLGITMIDATGGRGPCVIEGATRDGPAEAAGLRSNDRVLAVDGKPIANCSALLDEITGHAPGETVEIKVDRLGRALAVKAQLTTRDALLHHMMFAPERRVELNAGAMMTVTTATIDMITRVNNDRDAVRFPLPLMRNFQRAIR